MIGQYKQVLDAVDKVLESSQALAVMSGSLAKALKDNEKFIFDLDQKADLKRSLEADVARLTAERSDADAKAEAAKQALAQIRKNLG